MKVVFGILIGIVAVVVVLVLVAGYFGFVPGVSKIFGSDKPRNLGVTYASSDYTGAIATAGVKVVDLPAGTPPGQSLSFSGTQTASFNLTGAQATALIDDNTWPYNPLADCQVRFNSDGTAEISGLILTDKLNDWALAHGYSGVNFTGVLKSIQIYAVIQKSLPFYIKGTGSVVNGVTSFDVSKFEIGRLSIPVSQINGQDSAIIDGVSSWVSRIPGFSVNNLSITGGQLHFDGTLPQTITRAVSGTG